MESVLLQMQYFISCSPFAPVSDDGGKASSSTYEADSEEPCEKEGAAMTLVDQVVHADCRPVLEFGMVGRQLLSNKYKDFTNQVLETVDTLS